MGLAYELTGVEAETIKIGCADGSGFFYCGPRREFINDLFLHEKALLRQEQKYKAEAAKALNDAVKGVPNPVDYAKAAIRKNHDPFHLSVQAYDNMLDDYFKRITKLHEILERKKYLLKNRVPLYKRSIVETYPSIDPGEGEDVMIVIIDGFECGKYWTVNEYANGIDGGDELESD